MGFTHIDADGAAVMVDVGGKEIAKREAVATGRIRMNAECFASVRDGMAKKGDVLAVARVAGIMASKRAPELIPLCHPLNLTKSAVEFTLDAENLEIIAICAVCCEGATGVEMEALTDVTCVANTVCRTEYSLRSISIYSPMRKFCVFAVWRYLWVSLSSRSPAASRSREDKSGPAISSRLRENGYEIIEELLLPDDRVMLENELIRLCDQLQPNLILTTGGTGFSPADITPEATLAVADRQACGIAEAIRAASMAITARAMLSRAVSVIRGSTLIINLPGSPKACMESLDVFLNVIPHAMGLLRGEVSDCAVNPAQDTYKLGQNV